MILDESPILVSFAHQLGILYLTRHKGRLLESTAAALLLGEVGDDVIDPGQLKPANSEPQKQWNVLMLRKEQPGIIIVIKHVEESI